MLCHPTRKKTVGKIMKGHTQGQREEVNIQRQKKQAMPKHILRKRDCFWGKDTWHTKVYLYRKGLSVLWKVHDLICNVTQPLAHPKSALLLLFPIFKTLFDKWFIFSYIFRSLQWYVAMSDSRQTLRSSVRSLLSVPNELLIVRLICIHRL